MNDRTMPEEENSSSSVPAGASPDRVAVLIPAAGDGSRLGGRRKQFRGLGDRPLLIQTVFAFERHPKVGPIVVTAPPEEDGLREAREMLYAAGLKSVTAVVPGGTSRQASVRRAVRAVPASADVVLVHDAVRPFVSEAAITRVIAAVRREGAAALAIPVVDTLRRGRNGRFEQTVARDGLYHMQTPQGFRRDWLEEAHRRAAEGNVTATDDVELVQRIGRAVHIVSGSAHNFKITTAEDWALAQRIWPAWTKEVPG